MTALDTPRDRMERALVAMGASTDATRQTLDSMGELLKSHRFHVGTLLEHGSAPYAFVQGQPENYFVRLQTEVGPTVVWGQDLARALQAGEAQLGQMAVVAYRGLENVADASGAQTRRNGWLVDSLASLHEDAQYGVVQPGSAARAAVAADSLKAATPAAGPQANAEPAPAQALPNTRQQQAIDVLARAMGIARVPKEIADSLLIDVAQTLQTGSGPVRNLRLVKTDGTDAGQSPGTAQPRPLTPRL